MVIRLIDTKRVDPNNDGFFEGSESHHRIIQVSGHPNRLVLQDNYPLIFGISPDIGQRHEFWVSMKADMGNLAHWDVEVAGGVSRKKFQNSNVARRLTQRLVLVSARHDAGGLTI